jgi:RHS repeat-associated protein
LQDLNYYYDSVGNIVQVRDDAQQTHYFSNQVVAPTSTFEYDALYRLTKATGRELNGLVAPTGADFVNNKGCPNTASNAMRNYTYNYSYDQLGNILQMGSSGQWTRSFIYSTLNNCLTGHNQSQSTPDYTYDAHGNMLSMPNVTNMVWSHKDELISAENGSTFTSYYAYDAEGNRSRKVTVKGSVREERYYIGAYEIYRKYTNTTLNTERKSVNVADDEKVFLRRDGTLLRYQYDNHLGSACLELDATGAVISYEEYHPFGTTSYRAGRSETEVSLKRYKYCGKEKDEETGLYYYGARYYASWLCRFVSVDPLKDKYPNISPYAYCANNPIKYIDPFGESFEITETTNEDGKKVVNINFTAYLENKSSMKMSEKEMQGYVDRMTGAIKEYYSGIKTDADGNEFHVNVTSDIVFQKKETTSIDVFSRHAIFIVDEGQVPHNGVVDEKIDRQGTAEVGGKRMWLSAGILEHSPSNFGGNKQTGFGIDGAPTLERTFAHEFGHLGGLLDVSLPNGNLMIQGQNSNAGTQITGEQIKEMQSNYSTTHSMRELEYKQGKFKFKENAQKINKGISILW